ncbi:cyanophycinase [Noviherbaspirillum galbum]|uniref:Cyanophycinase n=1 Tax=Noviherbaspirillum galbum TaxID=2709383 RepID=A0A6B3SME6_9BURK|nr:cyanophycinase [Noviherbaspirillum galbum]NEX59552.1 cyanophycinase [Noviherbaspirillum galbum]
MTLLCFSLAISLLTASLTEASAASAPVPEKTPPKGSLVIAGGNLHFDNLPVWERIVQLAGGKGAKIAVFASASVNPKRSGTALVNMLNKAGAQAFFVPVAVKLEESDYQRAAMDPELVAEVRSATGVYFSGGDQGRITQALRTPEGKNTPMLDAVWDVYRKGGVIAGSSAGAAIMSETMFFNARPILSMLKNGVRDGKDIAPGLGFIGPDVFVDQHLLVRGRFARMMPAMMARNYKLGLGVDENTAMVVTGSQVEVIGYKGVLLVDLSQASTEPGLGRFNIKNAKLSYLDRGDKFDFATKEFTPSKEKLSGKLDPAKPYFRAQRFVPDILSNTAVVELMQDLIDNRHNEMVGLAFGNPNGDTPDVGFEFRFRKGADSMGYYTGAYGGEDYSVLNIYLDVRPVAMQLPLYK